MPAPSVTVLMPVYNGAQYLRQAVDSILGQTFTDFEFLIVNDGSTDDTQQILKSYNDPRMRVLINSTNHGIGAALNLGLAQARGQYIARQDADDISHPTRLTRQVAFLRANPAIALLGTQTRSWKHGHPPRTFPAMWRALDHEAIKFQALFSTPFIHTSVMFRLEVVWKQLGGYSCDYRICQDYDLWLRVLRQHQVANLPDYLADFRIHPQSISRSPAAADVQARVELQQINMPHLISDLRGLEAFAQLRANAHYHRSQLASQELRAIARLAKLCLQRSLPQQPGALRWQLRRVYAGYLLSIAIAQRGLHLSFALSCAARALLASPTLVVTTTLEWLRMLARTPLAACRSGLGRTGSTGSARPMAAPEIPPTR